jgi:hypothetical protein
VRGCFDKPRRPEAAHRLQSLGVRLILSDHQRSGDGEPFAPAKISSQVAQPVGVALDAKSLGWNTRGDLERRVADVGANIDEAKRSTTSEKLCQLN